MMHKCQTFPKKKVQTLIDTPIGAMARNIIHFVKGSTTESFPPLWSNLSVLNTFSLPTGGR